MVLPEVFPAGSIILKQGGSCRAVRCAQAGKNNGYRARSKRSSLSWAIIRARHVISIAGAPGSGRIRNFFEGIYIGNQKQALERQL
ncbi:MAG TPA: hypothetical protein VGE12_02920 [Noviherbaspirillum sp.]